MRNLKVFVGFQMVCVAVAIFDVQLLKLKKAGDLATISKRIRPVNIVSSPEASEHAETNISIPEDQREKEITGPTSQEQHIRSEYQTDSISISYSTSFQTISDNPDESPGSDGTSSPKQPDSTTTTVTDSKAWKDSCASVSGKYCINITENNGVMVPPQSSDGQYRTKTCLTFLLSPSRDLWNASSVMLRVKFVDLDETSGDYLLIGTGKEPFAGPNPVFLTGERNEMEYYVANEYAYVVFVSGDSKMKKKGFRIEWERSGQLISKPEVVSDKTSIPDYILQSVQVCFYNASAKEEFNKTGELRFPKFREELVRIANEYAQEKNLRLLYKLKAEDVDIYRLSLVVKPSEDDAEIPQGVIYTMVAIVHNYNRKSAVFSRQHLEAILDRFNKDDNKNDHSWLGFKVGHCPSGNNFSWYMAAILLLILSMATFIILWIFSIIRKWRSHSSKPHKSSLMFCCPEPRNPVKENEYVNYSNFFDIPKILFPTDEGDCDILSDEIDHQHSGVVNYSDEESDREIFNKNWTFQKKQSPQIYSSGNNREPSTLKTLSSPHPLGTTENSQRLWTPMKMDKLEDKVPEPVEHVYDLLDSNIKEREEESRL